MPKIKRGIFIALEGVDGSGSSTQTKMLVDLLREKGFDAVATKEPNPDGKVEPVIRGYLGEADGLPALDALLFAADRVDHSCRLVGRWLESRKIVVSDRYLESSVAYQTSQGLSENWVLSINRFALKPDLTIIMDIDPEVSLLRKDTPRERFERAAFLSTVRARFLERAAQMGHEVVDASRSVDEVHAAVVKAVLPLLLSVSDLPAKA